MKKYTSVIEFEHKWHRDIFEMWLSEVGEQDYWNMLDSLKENEGDCPKKLLNLDISFNYPKDGSIITSVYESEE